MCVLSSFELANIGQLLYGDCWKTELARHLGVSRQTIIRWAKGAHPVPEDVIAEVHQLAWERYKELEMLFVSATKTEASH
jgi:DNA-binding XRE family transcriptional regulator